MFKRSICIELEKWLSKNDRKPLVIRGARQVGKYHLLNLPYYLASQTERYLQWFQNKIKNS